MRGQVGVLDRVRVRRVFDLSALEEDLERAVEVAERGLCDGNEGESARQEVLFWLKLKLAVVDSIAAIVLPELADGKVNTVPRT